MITSYNAGAVKICDATNNIARFRNKIPLFTYCKNAHYIQGWRCA
jgi:hypothetical protein